MKTIGILLFIAILFGLAVYRNQREKRSHIITGFRGNLLTGKIKWRH